MAGIYSQTRYRVRGFEFPARLYKQERGPKQVPFPVYRPICMAERKGLTRAIHGARPSGASLCCGLRVAKGWRPRLSGYTLSTGRIVPCWWDGADCARDYYVARTPMVRCQVLDDCIDRSRICRAVRVAPSGCDTHHHQIRHTHRVFDAGPVN